MHEAEYLLRVSARWNGSSEQLKGYVSRQYMLPDSKRNNSENGFYEYELQEFGRRRYLIRQQLLLSDVPTWDRLEKIKSFSGCTDDWERFEKNRRCYLGSTRDLDERSFDLALRLDAIRTSTASSFQSSLSSRQHRILAHFARELERRCSGNCTNNARLKKKVERIFESSIEKPDSSLDSFLRIERLASRIGETNSTPPTELEIAEVDWSSLSPKTVPLRPTITLAEIVHSDALATQIYLAACRRFLSWHSASERPLISTLIVALGAAELANDSSQVSAILKMLSETGNAKLFTAFKPAETSTLAVEFPSDDELDRFNKKAERSLKGVAIARRHFEGETGWDVLCSVVEKDTLQYIAIFQG